MERNEGERERWQDEEKNGQRWSEEEKDKRNGEKHSWRDEGESSASMVSHTANPEHRMDPDWSAVSGSTRPSLCPPRLVRRREEPVTSPEHPTHPI